LHDTVSKTALGTAIGRAVETFRSGDDRLFEDRYAIEFLPALHRIVLRILLLPALGPALLSMREKQVPGIMGNLLCRTRFIDDALRTALANGHEQVLLLGAGFDSRAYRIRGADRVPVFELDHPATQAWKLERMERTHKTLPKNVTFAPIDFAQQGIGEVLAAAGFRTGARTFVIWEGVTQYIGGDAVDDTFRFLARSVGKGSEMVFTYILRNLIEGSVQTRGDRKLLETLEHQGEPWIFGFDPAELPEYLAARSLKLLEDVGAADYRARYLEPIGRTMNLFEGERVAVARRMFSEPA
jgi:methyltransferase (TIGR00027 family)